MGKAASYLRTFGGYTSVPTVNNTNRIREDLPCNPLVCTVVRPSLSSSYALLASPYTVRGKRNLQRQYHNIVRKLLITSASDGALLPPPGRRPVHARVMVYIAAESFRKCCPLLLTATAGPSTSGGRGCVGDPRRNYGVLALVEIVAPDLRKTLTCSR